MHRLSRQHAQQLLHHASWGNQKLQKRSLELLTWHLFSHFMYYFWTSAICGSWFGHIPRYLRWSQHSPLVLGFEVVRNLRSKLVGFLPFTAARTTIPLWRCDCCRRLCVCVRRLMQGVKVQSAFYRFRVRKQEDSFGSFYSQRQFCVCDNQQELSSSGLSLVRGSDRESYYV